MNKMTRREVLPAVAAPFVATAAARGSEIAVAEIRHSYEDYLYRTPIKFGGTVVDRVTLLNVDCVVRTARGQDGQGLRLHAAGQRLVVPSHD